MRYSINVHGHTEPVEISSEPGRVVVCGLGYLPFEADMIGLDVDGFGREHRRGGLSAAGDLAGAGRTRRIGTAVDLCDSGCLTALLLLKTLSDQGQSLTQAMEETKKYHISGEINSKVKDADAVIAEIEAKYGPKGKVVKIDGMSVIGDTWWLNLRKSNTEPLLRLNCEAKTKEEMEKLRDDLLAIIRR